MRAEIAQKPLNAVHVLAEPLLSGSIRGEAREGTNLTFTDGVALPDVKSDSRGGVHTLPDAKLKENKSCS